VTGPDTALVRDGFLLLCLLAGLLVPTLQRPGTGRHDDRQFAAAEVG
jgi:hypothetical protein